MSPSNSSASREGIATLTVYTAEEEKTPKTNNADTIDSDPSTYPEGGWVGWGVVLGSWMSLFGSMSLMNSIGTWQAYLVRNQLSGHSSTAVGWVFGVYNGLTFLLGVQTGPIFDARGPRLLIACGGTLTVLYLMLLGICMQYWHFMLVFGLLGGLSLSLVFGPAIAIVAHYFNKRRALATGIASSGGAVGGIVVPLMLQRLFQMVGWAWATRITGLVCILTFSLGVLLMRPRFPAKQLTFATVTPDITIFRHGGIFLTGLGIFFLEWGLFTPVTYLASYALDDGLSARFAYTLLALINAGGVFGRWVPGYFADRVGRFNVLILTVLGCFVTLLCFWLPVPTATSGERPLLILLAVVFGFFSGGNLSLAPVCVGQLCKLHSYGRYYSTVYMFVSISMFTGTALGGRILAASGNDYRGLILFAAASYLASFVTLVLAKMVCCGRSNIWATF